VFRSAVLCDVDFADYFSAYGALYLGRTWSASNFDFAQAFFGVTSADVAGHLAGGEHPLTVETAFSGRHR
jgi:hypothetical protein